MSPSLLLVGTPLLVLAKLVHGFAAQRVSVAPRGSRGVKAELVTWLLLAAVDSHTFALWSSVAYQAEDLCARFRPDLGGDVYPSGGYFFDYPVRVQCVWSGGESVNASHWALNIVTALFVVAALAVTAHAAVRAYRRYAQHDTAP